MTATTKPIEFTWDAEANAMIPVHHQTPLARRQFAHGHKYRLQVQYERSPASLAHMHATLADIYENLSDDWKEEYPDVEHFRKRLLIKLGYRREKDYICKSADHALHFMKLIQDDDEYAVIVQRGKVVRKYTAMSQSVNEADMDAAKFQESKTRLLDLAASLVGTTRKDAERNGSKGT